MLNTQKAGCTLGLVLGGWHLAWSALVAMGVAQTVLDFLFWIHFISPAYTVEPFAIGRASVLVAATLAIGYVLGASFAALWNMVHRRNTATLKA